MKRTLALIATLLAFSLVVALPVAAGPTSGTIRIAVPDYINVDGGLDVVVLTGTPSAMVEATSCLGPGVFPEYRVAIVDHSQKTGGAFAGVIASTEVKGPIFDMVHVANCFWDIGVGYRVYEGSY